MKKLLILSTFFSLCIAMQAQQYVLKNNDTLVVSQKDTTVTRSQTVTVNVTYPVVKTTVKPFVSVPTPPVDTTTPPPPPPPPPPVDPGVRNNIVFEDMFERADPKARYAAQRQWYDNNYSIQSSTTVVGEGTRSVRFEHKGTEYLSGGYRTEFQSSLFPSLAEQWHGYRIYFENWKPTCTCAEHINQFHPTLDGGSANLGIYTEANTFNVRLNPESGSSATTIRPISGSNKQIVPNKWYSIVLHVKWAATGGRVEMWIDGEKYLDFTGPTLTRGGIPYFKMGINRWNGNSAPGASNPRVFYIDAYRIGNANATYADVAP